MREDDMTERFSDTASRRAFLTGLAAAGATATMTSGLAFGQQASKTEAAAKPKHHGVIDVHHHFWAPEYLKAQDDWEDAHHVPHAPPMQSWTPEVSLAEMDKSGVQTAILSLASISQGMWGLDPAAAHKVCLSCADYGAKVVADHKGRFGLF